jgi:hypothetical protein
MTSSADISVLYQEFTEARIIGTVAMSGSHQ